MVVIVVVSQFYSLSLQFWSKCEMNAEPLFRHLVLINKIMIMLLLDKTIFFSISQAVVAK